MTSKQTVAGPLASPRRTAALILATVAVAVGAVAIFNPPPPASAPVGSRAPSAAALAPPTASPSLGPSQSGLPGPSASIAISARRGIVAVRIVIPRLGIDLPIVEGDGMGAPIGKAAHFPGTAWPDAASNTYLYGHAQKGMFLALWEARPGDQILLTLVDGQQRCFAVDEIIPKAPWNATSLLLPTDHERLTLQTSTSYTPTAPRFIVIALPCV